MPSKEEKKRRKALSKEVAQKQFDDEVSRMPISKNDLKALFDYLDRPDPPPCDHTLKDTIWFLDKHNLDKNTIIPWLNEYGGYCDCEVIYNVDDKWSEYVGREYDYESLEDEATNISINPKPWWKFWK